jgi:type I restriction-modification system DNA methylase subunit
MMKPFHWMKTQIHQERIEKMKEIFNNSFYAQFIAGLVLTLIFTKFISASLKLFNRILEKRLIKKRLAERQEKLWQERVAASELTPETRRLLEKHLQEKVLPEGNRTFRHF